MVSISINKARVPPNGIVFQFNNNTLPFGYTHESSLFSKYTKGIATA